MTVVERPISLPLPEKKMLIGPEPNQTAVATTLELQRGVLKGKLLYSNDCRLGMIAQQRNVIRRTEKPNYGAGVTSLIVGAMATVISGAVMSNLDTFSDEETCSVDSQGQESCSSARGRATAGGVVGMISGVALLGTGLGTLARREKSKDIESDEPITSGGINRINETGVPCGEGPAGNFGLALRRGDIMVAQTTANSDGEFAFAIPPTLTGQVSIYVDSVPNEPGFVEVGSHVTSFDISAEHGPENDLEPPGSSAPSVLPKSWEDAK